MINTVVGIVVTVAIIATGVGVGVYANNRLCNRPRGSTRELGVVYPTLWRRRTPSGPLEPVMGMPEVLDA